jgi:hypothetical protein
MMLAVGCKTLLSPFLRYSLLDATLTGDLVIGDTTVYQFAEKKIFQNPFLDGVAGMMEIIRYELYVLNKGPTFSRS